MLTRSGAGVRKCRDVAIGTIDLLKRKTVVLEQMESLTEGDRQSAMRMMTGLLTSVTTGFKNNHFTLTDLIEDEDEAKTEQGILQEHEFKVMDLVDHLGKLMHLPHKIKPITALDLPSKLVDQVEKSYKMIKGHFDNHRLDMDIYIYVMAVATGPVDPVSTNHFLEGK